VRGGDGVVELVEREVLDQLGEREAPLAVQVEQGGDEAAGMALTAVGVLRSVAATSRGAERTAGQGAVGLTIDDGWAAQPVIAVSARLRVAIVDSARARSRRPQHVCATRDHQPPVRPNRQLEQCGHQPRAASSKIVSKIVGGAAAGDRELSGVGVRMRV
jgi:hypothetical protein